jgi:hypothetical protein
VGEPILSQPIYLLTPVLARVQYTGLAHTLDDDGSEVMKCYESEAGRKQVVGAVTKLANQRLSSMALLGTTRTLPPRALARQSHSESAAVGYDPVGVGRQRLPGRDS